MQLSVHGQSEKVSPGASSHPVPGLHPLPASGAWVGIYRGLHTVSAGHRVDVGPPSNQAAFRYHAVHGQGLASGALRGSNVEAPQATGGSLNHPIQVVHLDGVVGITDSGLLEPLGASHPGPGHLGLMLGHPVGVVQQGVQESADAVGVQMLGGIKPHPQ